MSEENTSSSNPTQKKGWWKSSLATVGSTAASIGKTTTQASTGVLNATGSATNFIGNKVVESTQAVTGKVKSATGTTTNAVVKGSQIVSTATVNAANFVGNTTVKAGKSVASTTAEISTVAGSATIGATTGIGSLIGALDKNPQVEKIAALLKVDALLPLLDKVNIVKAKAQVELLQQQYPNDTPKQIAHRIMMKKALLVGGSGAVASMAPGVAAPLFAVDLSANIATQAEMLYQIAGAYGLNLQDPARKGEIIGIFGLVFGGKYAIKTGLQLVMRNVPVAGAVVGAGTNAATLYATGHMACSFYERKTVSSCLTVPVKREEEEDCFESAFKQQLLMDQVLIHMFIAEEKSRTWKNIKVSLDNFNLSTSSVEAISSLPKLPSIEDLLDELDKYFAQSLLSQCEQIAHADGVLTTEESRIIQLIEQKLETVH
ncbi:MAG: hypothetical protein AAGN15_12300 [Cyanobacteria bacterium J06581_3]